MMTLPPKRTPHLPPFCHVARLLLLTFETKHEVVVVLRVALQTVPPAIRDAVREHASPRGRAAASARGPALWKDSITKAEADWMPKGSFKTRVGDSLKSRMDPWRAEYDCTSTPASKSKPNAVFALLRRSHGYVLSTGSRGLSWQHCKK